MKIRNGKRVKVRAWLARTHPEERGFLGGFNGDVTFAEVRRRMEGGEEFDAITGCTESVQREYVFGRLAELYGRDYEHFYRLWLEAGWARRPELVEPLAEAKGINLEKTGNGKTKGETK